MGVDSKRRLLAIEDFLYFNYCSVNHKELIYQVTKVKLTTFLLFIPFLLLKKIRNENIRCRIAFT